VISGRQTLAAAGGGPAILGFARNEAPWLLAARTPGAASESMSKNIRASPCQQQHSAFAASAIDDAREQPQASGWAARRELAPQDPTVEGALQHSSNISGVPPARGGRPANRFSIVDAVRRRTFMPRDDGGQLPGRLPAPRGNPGAGRIDMLADKRERPFCQQVPCRHQTSADTRFRSSTPADRR